MQNIEHKILSEKDAGKSVKEFEVEVPAETLDRFRNDTLKKLAAEAELPGFRKGKAPEALVLKETGEMRVLEEAANNIINKLVFSLITEKKLRFIGEPRVTLTAIAEGNPLRFKVAITVAPEITLPDYKKIASDENHKKIPAPEVTEKELQEALEHIKRILAQGQANTDKSAPKTVELTDETVQKLGSFKSVAEFTDRLKKDMLKDKESRQKEKRVLEIIEAVVNKTSLEMPEMLVEYELDRIESEFSHDVERMGQKYDEYLKKIKKTGEELRKEWRDNAEKRAKFELIMPRIAKEENLTVPPEEIEKETNHLLEHHKDAEKETAKLYVERALLRQKVLSFLEACR